MKLLRLIFFVLIVAGLSSCSAADDSNESVSDPQFNDEVWLDTGTVIAVEDTFKIETDDGFLLVVSNKDDYNADYTVGERVLVYFIVLEDMGSGVNYDYNVQVEDMESILTKSLITYASSTVQEETDSIGDIAIQLEDAWITGDYLNVQFEYYGAHEIHYVNLVYNKDNQDSDDDIVLELKHNDNGDDWTYLYWGIISFDISDLRLSSESNVNIKVKALNYTGGYDSFEDLTYTYDEDEASTKTYVSRQDFRSKLRNPKGEK